MGGGSEGGLVVRGEEGVTMVGGEDGAVGWVLGGEGLAVFADQETCQLDVGEQQPLLTDQVLASLTSQLSHVEVPACLLPELLELREAVVARLAQGEGEGEMVDLVNQAVGLSLRVIAQNGVKEDEVDSGLAGSAVRPRLPPGPDWTDSFRPHVRSEVERELRISVETKAGLKEISCLQVGGQGWLKEGDICQLLPDWGGSRVLESLSVPSCCLVGEEDTELVVLFQLEGVIRLLEMFEPEMGRSLQRLSSSADSLVP